MPNPCDLETESGVPYEAPFIDACVHLHLLTDLVHKLPGVDRRAPVLDALHLPPNFSAAVCVFSDAASILPEGAGPHHRAWERLGGDSRLYFAFGVRAADAPLYNADVYKRLEGYLTEVGRAVAVGLVGLDYRQVGVPSSASGYDMRAGFDLGSNARSLAQDMACRTS